MPTIIRFWILFSSLLVSAGWILSAFHQLNRAGYIVVFILSAIALLFFKNILLPENIDSACLQRKILHRFERPVPFLFFVLLILSLFAGSLYEATNWDTNAYRLPRVFHWLWNEQWHWIHTLDARMNIAGCNFEWLAAPLVLFSHTDRLLFLINWSSYLLLPGLIFSVFVRLQVSPRVAWWWMWFLSAGWCFVFQASAVANDSFGVIYALAAVDLALRARESRNVADLWLSALAMALATGIKQTNIPLVLPWFVATLPSLPLLLKHKSGTGIIIFLSVLVSILPISFFNWKHYGTWLPTSNSGVILIGKFDLNPFWGIIGNAFCIPTQNFVPPFYEFLPPFYADTISVWNNWMDSFAQTPFGSHFNSFEHFGFLSGEREHGVSEGNAGIGLGVCILIIISILGAFRFRKMKTLHQDKFLFLLRFIPWISLLIFMAKVGSYENARQLAPYYPLLLPVLLAARGHDILARKKLWKRIGLATMLFTAFLVVTSSKRPLFPPGIVFGLLNQEFPDNQSVHFEAIQYLASMNRGIELRRNCLQENLPSDAKTVGYYVGVNDGDEPGLWLPYGKRQVEWILPDDSPADLRARNIHYVLIYSGGFVEPGMTIQQWMQKYNASKILQFNLAGGLVSEDSPSFSGYYLTRLN